MKQTASNSSAAETRLPMDQCQPGPGRSRVLNFGPAQIMSMPVIHYDQNSRSGQQYMDLAQEVLQLAPQDRMAYAQ